MGSPPKFQGFVPLPVERSPMLAWPTGNRFLFSAPHRFFARTAANPWYGRPGWTRDAGRRFHRGCDIAALCLEPTGRTVRVLFTDPHTGRDVPSDQPAYVPYDEVFCVADGRVEECVNNPSRSDFGVHIVVRHPWGGGAEDYFTLYGHLVRADVRVFQPVRRGQRIGVMGLTSRSADARRWMSIAPHLHFEAWDRPGRAYDPEAFLKAFLAARPDHRLRPSTNGGRTT